MYTHSIEMIIVLFNARMTSMMQEWLRSFEGGYHCSQVHRGPPCSCDNASQVSTCREINESFSLWQLIYFVVPFSLCRILESGKGTDQYSKSSSNTVSIDELDKLFYNSCWWCCLKNELNSYICTIAALNYFAITEKWNLI